MLFVKYHRWARITPLQFAVEFVRYKEASFTQNTRQSVLPLSSDNRTDFVSEIFLSCFTSI